MLHEVLESNKRGILGIFCCEVSGLLRCSVPSMSMKIFHAHELYRIMFYLSTQDVVRCMQVCKYSKVNAIYNFFFALIMTLRDIVHFYF